MTMVETRAVTGGVDTHADMHVAAALDPIGGLLGVGVASGRAIRSSIVSVVVINLLLSIVFWGAHNTVSIAG